MSKFLKRKLSEELKVVFMRKFYVFYGTFHVHYIKQKSHLNNEARKNEFFLV